MRRLLGFLVAVAIAAAPISRSAARADSPTPSPSPAATENPQNSYYGAGVTRNYSLLQQNDRTSFPDFYYFMGISPTNGRGFLGRPPPGAIPLCSTAGVQAPKPRFEIAGAGGEGALSDMQLATSTELLKRDIAALDYRLRACDFYLSVYAWNTRRSAHEATFDFSWKNACNSFAYEYHTQGDWINELLSQGNPTTLRPSERAKLYLQDYDRGLDLYQRVESCSQVVATGTIYPPNTRRFFCSYGGFIGGLLTASALAFGRHWGGSTASTSAQNQTQAQVSALGTVMTATLPSLCQNGGSRR